MNRRRGYESNAHRLADLNGVTEILAFLLFWPVIFGITYVLLDPYGARDWVLRALGVA